MTAPFVTQCPNCGTAFEVSDRELSMADGIVRCGQCRHVFTATDFQVETDLVPATGGGDELPDFAMGQDIGEVEDLSSNIRFGAGQADESITAHDVPEGLLFDDSSHEFTHSEPLSAGTAAGQEALPADDTAHDAGNPDDSAAGEHGFDSDSGDDFRFGDDEPPAFGFGSSHDDTPPSFGSGDDEDAEESHEGEDSAGHGEADSEFSDVREVILDDFDDAAFDTGSFENTGFDTSSFDNADTRTGEAVSDHDISRTRDDMPALTDELAAAFDALDADSPRSSTPPPLVAEDRLASEPIHQKLHHIGKTAPIELKISYIRPGAISAWLTIAVVVLGLLGLAVQLVAYRFDQASRNSLLREPLTRICALAGCKVPPLSDPARLQASNLVIRSHPHLKKALVADFILVNEADFDQPPPALLLKFSDPNGFPVGQRLLQPADYLSGEMAGAHSLPARQAVHVSLELLDPGPAAVSYTLQPLTAH